MRKEQAEIHGKYWEVGYPFCEGCSELVVGGSCAYEGNGCRYPDKRVENPRTFYGAFSVLKGESKLSLKDIREKEIEKFEKDYHDRV